MISFDDANMPQERWRTDGFVIFREIFEDFDKCCGKTMSPNDYIQQEVVYHSRHTTKINQLNKF